jgi:hypothetical protein
MKINILGMFHQLPGACSSNGFFPFSPVRHAPEIYLVKKAIELIRQKSRGNMFCNLSFQTLPRGRSFDDVFDDASIWISLVKHKPFVAGLSIGNEIGIYENTFSTAKTKSNPAEIIASVILHELAHVAGAPDNPDMAEWLLIPCGFSNVADYGPGGMTDL